jgi:hypothetical protein
MLEVAHSMTAVKAQHQAPTPAAPRQLILPAAIISKVEVGRMLNELEQIDEALLQLGLRQGGAGQGKMPKTSWLMDKFATENKLNLLHEADRQGGMKFLTAVRDHAPVLKISFSVDPSPAFTERLMTWLRREIHPQVMISIGLQPNLGAGCVIYGNSKFFDLSLKQTFEQKRPLLLQRLLAKTQAGGQS